MSERRAGLRHIHFALIWLGVLLFSLMAATTSGCRPQPIDAHALGPPAVVLVDYTWPWKQEQFIPKQGGQARWGIRSGLMTFENNDFESQDDFQFLGTFMRGKQRGPFNMEFTLGFSATPDQVSSQNLFIAGGGAIDPISGVIGLGLAGAALLAGRRRRNESESGSKNVNKEGAA